MFDLFSLDLITRESIQAVVIGAEVAIILYADIKNRTLTKLNEKLKHENERLNSLLLINGKRAVFRCIEEPKYANTGDIWITLTGMVKAYSGHPAVGWAIVTPEYRAKLREEGI